MKVPPGVLAAVVSPGHRHRRAHISGGLAHIEVRGLFHPVAAEVAEGVCKALSAVKGIDWVGVDVALQRVVVAFDDHVVDLDDMIDLIESVETVHGAAAEGFPLDEPEHPADPGALRRHVVAICADTAGLGLGLFGRALRSTPVPVELASIVTLIDGEVRLRRILEASLGTPVTELGLAVVNAVGQGLTQGPLGLVTDMAHRLNLVAESLTCRQAVTDAEKRRWSAGLGDQEVTLPLRTANRPVAVPGGPIERYSDRAGLAALAAAATTYAATASPRRAAAVLLAGVPKAARLGREAFAAHLCRALIKHDLLVLDARALRRLDRVDTLVIDDAMLATGRMAVGGIRLLEGADSPEVHRRLSLLFDATDPTRRRKRGRWELGPAQRSERRRIDINQAVRDLNSRLTLVLRDGGHPVAVIGVEDELSAAALHVIRSARRQGHMVAIAGQDPGLIRKTGADLLVSGGTGLTGAVCSLQQDGCVVALLAQGGSHWLDALRAADIGLEVSGVDGAVWAGDIILNQVKDAAFVVDAIASAREVSRQSAAIALIGSGAGTLLALGGLPGSAASRASSAINAAALAGMANGVRAAVRVNRTAGRVPSEPVRWHELDIAEVFARLRSDIDGLSDREAARRRRDIDNGGVVAPSILRSIGQELANPLTPVLAAGAGASAAVGGAADAAIVAGVSGLNALIGGVQRFSAERAILSLGQTSASPVRVRRPDSERLLTSEQLVLGDVVELHAGDAVPADCRIVGAEGLEVDESALTGESEPVGKGPEPTFSSVLAERSSMLYEGTTIAAGNTTAVVVAVGTQTTASTMALDSGQTAPAGGVEARLRHLTSVTLPIAAAGGGAVMGLGLLRGRSINQSIGSAVALAVAAVPEGLPLLATMAQLASARRLSARRALVRNPRAIEALGRVQVLCTDKTGTLTEGRIRLRRVSDGIDDVGLRDLPERYARIVAAGLRATPASTSEVDLPHLTDRAIVAGAAGCGIDVTAWAPGWRREAELPFEPARGYHAVSGCLDGGAVLSVKGAPEVVIRRCSRWASPTGQVMLDAARKRQLNNEVERLARQGLRVLAVAEQPASPGVLSDDQIAGLTLLGFVVLSDPVRPTAASALTALRRAGVDVVMVTGDHPSTAEGIAVELGILDGRRVLTGTELALLDDAELDAVVSDVSVFARVTPVDKVRIVAALQRRGQAVAMTGDGANDAPAIRLADVGIALGGHSTPAARRAADVVVTDERIETIVDAIIEGRGMWTSVREALAILLGGNLGEVAFTVAATVVTGRAPLSARQLLVVNLLTDVVPALVIALRPPPQRTPEALLAEGPDASLGRSLERAIALRAATTALGAATAWGLASLTGGPRRASTTALVALVGTQLGQTIVSGGMDPLVIAAAGGSFVALAGIVQVPGISKFFGSTPLDPAAWAIACASAAAATGLSIVGAMALRRVEHPVPNQRISPSASPPAEKDRLDDQPDDGVLQHPIAQAATTGASR
ncbi:MAG TPA: HAD-IC family P-type ATPase [Acidimicrobiales bacterium]